VTYFDQQNKAIDAGQIQGEKVVTSALMINKFILIVRHYISIIHGALAFGSIHFYKTKHMSTLQPMLLATDLW
jgi:hypothetical protein